MKYGRPVLTAIGAVRDALAAQLPSRRRVRKANETARVEALSRLRLLASSDVPSAVVGTVLVDCAWDNANYWVRYAFVRAALGLQGAREVGVLGAYGRARARSTMRALGIEAIVDAACDRGKIARWKPLARKLLGAATIPDDILRWSLPEELPPEIVYDGLLKRQRTGVVDLGHPLIEEHVAEALACIATASEIIGRTRPELLALSHTTNLHFASLAWVALRSGVKTIFPQGDFGVLRLIQARRPEDIFAYPSRPSVTDIATASPERRRRLREIGERYISHRLSGRTSDVSAIYAFGKRQATVSKSEIAARFGWDSSKPIMLVMAPNWFDFPHVSGAREYRDFVQWIEDIVCAVPDGPDVNWLFKAHPCDEWYGQINGRRLVDILPAGCPNVGLAETTWQGRGILEACDGILTFHGVGGIEAASLGKAVLLPYTGWYGHAGFATVAGSRAEYCRIIRSDWWRNVDANAIADRANEFAGWFFGMPDWHGGYTFAEDAHQDAIWRDLPAFLDSNASAVERDLRMTRAWFVSNEPFYHSYKMARCESFLPPIGQMKDSPQLVDPRHTQLKLAARP